MSQSTGIVTTTIPSGTYVPGFSFISIVHHVVVPIQLTVTTTIPWFISKVFHLYHCSLGRVVVPIK